MGTWRDPDGRPYAWSFTCAEHGHVYVAAEMPPSAEAMHSIHDSGCGSPCINAGPTRSRRYS